MRQRSPETTQKGGGQLPVPRAPGTSSFGARGRCIHSTPCLAVPTQNQGGLIGAQRQSQPQRRLTTWGRNDICKVQGRMEARSPWAGGPRQACIPGKNRAALQRLSPYKGPELTVLACSRMPQGRARVEAWRQERVFHPRGQGLGTGPRGLKDSGQVCPVKTPQDRLGTRTVPPFSCVGRKSRTRAEDRPRL